jgi:hypothetical protein
MPQSSVEGVWECEFSRCLCVHVRMYVCMCVCVCACAHVRVMIYIHSVLETTTEQVINTPVVTKS